LHCFELWPSFAQQLFYINGGQFWKRMSFYFTAKIARLEAIIIAEHTSAQFNLIINSNSLPKYSNYWMMTAPEMFKPTSLR
jgi:hypothetical protein